MLSDSPESTKANPALLPLPTCNGHMEQRRGFHPAAEPWEWAVMEWGKGAGSCEFLNEQLENWRNCRAERKEESAQKRSENKSVFRKAELSFLSFLAGWVFATARYSFLQGKELIYGQEDQLKSLTASSVQPFYKIIPGSAVGQII